MASHHFLQFQLLHYLLLLKVRVLLLSDGARQLLRVSLCQSDLQLCCQRVPERNKKKRKPEQPTAQTTRVSYWEINEPSLTFIITVFLLIIFSKIKVDEFISNYIFKLKNLPPLLLQLLQRLLHFFVEFVPLFTFLLQLTNLGLIESLEKR